MTPHSPAFASALASVEALLGPADATERAPLPAADSHVTVARWGRGGVSLSVRAYDGVPPPADVMLVAERLDGDSRAWTAIGDGTVRDACAWLGWALPRTTLPGLAPPDPHAATSSALDALDAARRARSEAVGYDANGSPIDDGCGGDQRSTTRGAMGEGDW